MTDWGGHHPDCAQWGMGTERTGPVEIRAGTILPAQREAISLHTADGITLVGELARRVYDISPYPVQIMGAITLLEGGVAEMQTGEGKTLAATGPMYLAALAGKGAHLATANDYLARRDAQWMGHVYRWLGLTVGCIQNQMNDQERLEAYAADITYGTNNEFGFDYLRDNMVQELDERVQRRRFFGIVDEVDNILIDEARTPLIISGRVADTAKWYRDFARIAERLQKDLHYDVDEAKRQVMTTEEGVTRVEEMLGIENMYDYSNVDLVHHLEAALKAKTLFEKDVEEPLDDILKQLAKMQYERTNLDLAPATFRLRGDVLEIYPPYDSVASRVSFWGDEVEVPPCEGRANNLF